MQSCRQEYSIHGRVIFREALSLGWSEEEDCLFKLIRKCSNRQEGYLKHTDHSIISYDSKLSSVCGLHLIRSSAHLLDSMFEGHNTCVLMYRKGK